MIYSGMKVSVLLLVALCAGCDFASADLIPIEFSSFSVSYSELAETHGFAFKTNSAINVTALGGAFDSLLPAVVGPVPPGYVPYQPYAIPSNLPVGIWNSAGTLLVSTTVFRSDPQTGHFTYRAITPVFLPIGDYTIGAFIPSGVGFGNRAVGAVIDPIITFEGRALVESSSLAKPTMQGTSAIISEFGPTFQFSVASVPEPATWLLIGTGLVGCGCVRRR